jgi:hypothetical protein
MNECMLECMYMYVSMYALPEQVQARLRTNVLLIRALHLHFQVRQLSSLQQRNAPAKLLTCLPAYLLTCLPAYIPKTLAPLHVDCARVDSGG